MIGTALCILAFLIVRSRATRSLGDGVVALLAIGYAYGLIRAWVPDSGGHFVFDAALAGLFSVELVKPPGRPIRFQSLTAENWLVVLLVWPIVCIAYSPLVADSQPFIIQLVGVRDALLMLPCILIGARFTAVDVAKIAKALAILNVVALGFGAAEYVFGVDAVVPQNDVTALVYLSNDVETKAGVFLRIPSTFLNAHSYGGTMVLTLPFVVSGLEAPATRERILAWAGIAAAAMGVFLCGARLPVTVLMVAGAAYLASIRLRSSTVAAVLLTAIALVLLVSADDRFQRFTTLGDTEMVRGRVSSSVNMSFFDVLSAYPLGAGFGRAYGTSIPYFLMDTPGLHEQLGMESEYGHLLVEQGIVGLLVWVAFIAYAAVRSLAMNTMTRPARAILRVVVVMTWLSGLIGVGILQAMPGAPLLLFGMGLILARPAPAAAPSLAAARTSEEKPPLRRPRRAYSGGWL